MCSDTLDRRFLEFNKRRKSFARDLRSPFRQRCGFRIAPRSPLHRMVWLQIQHKLLLLAIVGTEEDVFGLHRGDEDGGIFLVVPDWKPLSSIEIGGPRVSPDPSRPTATTHTTIEDERTVALQGIAGVAQLVAVNHTNQDA